MANHQLQAVAEKQNGRRPFARRGRASDGPVQADAGTVDSPEETPASTGTTQPVARKRARFLWASLHAKRPNAGTPLETDKAPSEDLSLVCVLSSFYRKILSGDH